MKEEKRSKFRYCHLCGKTESACFGFPKQNSECRNNWIQFCNITDSDQISVPFLCENHFETRFLFKKEKKTVLHNHAVPTIRIELSPTFSDEDEPPKKKRLRICCICGPTDNRLHKFPQDEVRKKEWLEILNMEGERRKNLRLCDSHFSASCLTKTPKGRVCLKYNAKPIVIQRENTSAIGSTQSTPASTASTSNSIEFNPITLENIRQSILLLTTERVAADSSRVAQHDSEVNISNKAVETNNDALKRASDPTLERETNTSTSDKSGNMGTPTTTTFTKKQPSIRYLADINTPALESPVTRRKCLSVIRMHRLTARKKIKFVQQQNLRLKKKISTLKTLLADLKKKDMITENAATTLLVHFNSNNEQNS